MDTTNGIEDFSKAVWKIMLNHGSFSAKAWLNQNLAVKGEEEDERLGKAFIEGMLSSLDAQGINDLERINRAFSELSRLGLILPLDTLRQFGMPSEGMFVIYSPSTGRIGDFLGQIRRLIAARYTNNLIISCQLPEEISYDKSCVIGGDTGLSTYRPFIYELSYQNLESFISPEAMQLAEQCPWLLRYAPKSFFNRLFQKDESRTTAAVSIHLRGGDALHNEDLIYHQPPISYYLDSIIDTDARSVELVSEPDNPYLGRINPLREKISKFCSDKGIKLEVASEGLSDDCRRLFNSRTSICGSSALGRELALASEGCQVLYLPNERPAHERLDVTEKFNLIEKMPRITYAKQWTYPPDQDWLNLESRYNWLLSN